MFQPISRRHLLKGLGAALALPWLESMAPAVSSTEQLTRPPLRTAFLFMPNGVVPDHYTPPGESEQWELTPMLQPLKNVKDELVLLENLWHEKTTGRNGHWVKVPAFLSGGYVIRTSGRDIDVGGISLDQVLAQKIGSRTPLPSFELGVEPVYTGVDNIGGGFSRIYGSHIAWRDQHTPVPKEIVPQLAFDRLFRTASAGPVLSGFNPRRPEVIHALQRDDTSVLDLVRDDAKALERRISNQDRAKLDEYLESVRSVEQRIEATMAPQKRWINEAHLDISRPEPGIPEMRPDHVQLMLDLMVLAFWTDTTRISTFMFGNAQSGMRCTFLDGVKDGFHALSHHLEDPAKRDPYERIGTWHIGQFAYLVEKMRQLDEGGTSLLDNSMLMFGSTLKCGSTHNNHDLPLILAGRAQGAIRPGRRLRYAVDTPLCNLYVTMLNIMGVETDQFGDSTGALPGLS
ncbi:DUF1552 domain-containing protein [Planctomicrobium sp. SH664]|uniref:DUF1552 domain-containing protein n=1 Tax=Planctomicrobium sp. SH664 TaxID=3448125 RepID=UPI003F5AEC1F